MGIQWNPRSGSYSTDSSEVELEFRNVDFCGSEGGKPKYLEINPRNRNKNQQETQAT